MPGAALTSVDGDSFAGTVKVKLGPVSLQYAGKGRFVERDEAAHRVVLEANGTDKRGNGTAGATVHARLEAAGDNQTRVVVDTDLKVTGRPAQFGRGVLQDVSGRIIEQFAGCLAARMTSSTPQPEPAEAQAPAAAASSAASSSESEAESASSATSSSESVSAESSSESAAAEASAAASSAGAPTSPAGVIHRETGASPGIPSSSNGSVPPRVRPTPPPAEAPAVELDLNAVVLPALARRYGPALLAGLLLLVVVRLLVRRRR
jgi:carbon monoxide dehydrogenase subunit G